MMERAEVEKKVIEAYHDQLGINLEDITLEKNIVDDLAADDLDEIECIMALEEAFGCAITEEEAQGVKTIGDAVELIMKKQAAKNS